MDPASIIDTLKNYQPQLVNQQQVRTYAVLVPLIEVDGETHLLFEVRSLHLRSQPGDVCFPGGRVDPTDANEKQAAIRETSEELGIKEDFITDVFPIDFYMPHPNRLIYPFVGVINENVIIVPNKAEVAETFTVPLQFFRENNPDIYDVTLEPIPEEDFPYHLIVGGEDYDWRGRTVKQYFYEYEGRVIWGLTARIILNFLSALEKKSE